MFEKGDLIIYGGNGVCRVEEIGVPEGIPVMEEAKQYYTLIPIFGTGKIYIPTDADVFMRPVISREEALELISKIPEIQEDTCCNCDQRILAEHYRNCIQSHQCEDLVQLIKTVYIKNQALTAQGRKPGKTDVQYMKRAEDLLHGELSVALDIPLEEVPGFIEQEVVKHGQTVFAD